MPFDRVIVVHVQAEGTFTQGGDFVPGATTDIRTWARVNDGGTFERIRSEGVDVIQRKVFTFRYREDIAMTPPDRLSVTDEHGFNFDIDTSIDYPERKRWIQLTGTDTRVSGQDN